MSATKELIKRVYPFMIALSPALVLFAANVDELFFYQAYRSVAVLMGGGGGSFNGFKPSAQKL